MLAQRAPTEEGTLEAAIARLDRETPYPYDRSARLLEGVRAKVAYRDRSKYVDTVSRLPNLRLFTKLDELQRCKQSWATSSASVNEGLSTLAWPLLELHIDELVSFESLRRNYLQEVSRVCGVPLSDVALHATELFATHDAFTPAAVWLGLACFVSKETDVGEAQLALRRLLNSAAAELASKVPDGAFKDDLYPENDQAAVAAGLVWRMLGAPYAQDRWRAAHCVRSLATLGRWDVVDRLGKAFHQRDAGAFQAPELAFYFMHARLWFLIALARLALDFPNEVARYKDLLLACVADDDAPHVLMRHFAAKGLLACFDAGAIRLTKKKEASLRNIDESPHPRVRTKIKKGGDYYVGQPANAPKAELSFMLDMDFDKHDVNPLSDVFGRPGWEVKDRISELVHRVDAKVTSMYESGGREDPNEHTAIGMTSRQHIYGQQLGWHALFFTAGELQRDRPVTDDSWRDDPWPDWLRKYCLTRDDGLWLSDGIDRTPLVVTGVLREANKQGLALTGDKRTLLSLIGLTSNNWKELVVSGSWRSADPVSVSVTSALVAPRAARRLGRQLAEEDPMRVWLPTYQEEEGGGEYLTDTLPGFTPWIVRPYWPARLDEEDPHGAPCAVRRARIVEELASKVKLRTDDAFGRIWTDPGGRIRARAEAWGREDKYARDGERDGERLSCSRTLLRRLLATNNKELLVLVKLERYEKPFDKKARFVHTIAVVHVKKTLDHEYIKGQVNKVYQSNW